MLKKNIHKLSKKILLGTSIGSAIIFMVIGIIFWGGFNTAMEETNTLEFCISCHEMKNNVYKEYIGTSHYKNRTGVRAMCSDCHVPQQWIHKVIRKIQASKEVVHKILGSIDTPEKFNEKRIKLANNVWETMKKTDSRECRNCHSFSAMEINLQDSRSGLVHKYSQHRNKTCIDCHKGIAHQLPEEINEIYKGGSDEDHSFYEKLKLKCYKCHSNMPNVDDKSWDDS